MTRTSRVTAIASAFLFLFRGCLHHVPAPAQDAATAEQQLDRWIERSLHPARIPPPSVDPGPTRIDLEGLSVEVTLVRPEACAWNSWSEGGARLFNDRGAIVVEIGVQAPGHTLVWSAEATSLEVNDASWRVPAASSSEPLLQDLLVHAWLDERWGLERGLVERTRAAGPFRAAYLTGRAAPDTLSGIVAFPLGERSDAHVVALRLTLGLLVDGEPVALTTVLE